MSNPTCRHCSEGVEHATGTDGETIVSDLCYGCRQRWMAAQSAATLAVASLETLKVLLEAEPADTVAINVSDETTRILAQMTSLERIVKDNT